jgi:CheY-like chemotaxis protein
VYGTQSATQALVKTILMVEDGRFLRVINERALVRAGYCVVTACDGEEGLRLACQRAPDLILLDMLLPKLSGLEVLRSLRATSQTARVPIVVLSSLPQSNEAQLRKDGATAYFDKATLNLHQQSESLVTIVKRILDERSEHVDGAGSPGLDLPTHLGQGGI